MNRHLFPVLVFVLFAVPAIAAQSSPPARWSQCAEQTLAAKSRQAASEGHGESYYFGASGGGARDLVFEACGPKPSLRALSAGERAVLKESCQKTDDFRDLSNAVTSWFYPYGQESPHWRLAVAECRRIYRSKAPGSTRAQPVETVAQSAPAPRSVHATQLEMCASLGGIAESFVQFRDAGIHLTTILQGLLPNGAEDRLGDLMQPLVLDIYRHSYWDAVYARRQAETRCLATFIP